MGEGKGCGGWKGGAGLEGMRQGGWERERDVAW